MSLNFYNRYGKPVCYTDNMQDIFSYGGKPLGYIYDDSIYLYNGKHVGWFIDNWIFDENMYYLFFSEKSIGGPLKPFRQFLPFKGFKQFIPFKEFRQFKPFKPFKKLFWSSLENIFDSN